MSELGSEPVNPSGLGRAELREKLAAIEHERWADWQRYMHSLCIEIPGQLGRVIPRQSWYSWERQIATPYHELSLTEKASDMEQVDRYWPLIEAELANVRSAEWVAAVEELIAANWAFNNVKVQRVGDPTYPLGLDEAWRKCHTALAKVRSIENNQQKGS
jgi:hypothetical protein